MNIPKMKNNKLSRQLIYKTVIGILPILCRFASSIGISDVHQLSDYICSLSIDEFCDYKFKDKPDPDQLTEENL